MKVYTKIKDNMFSKTSLALGFFDGLHLGHKQVILDTIKKSEELSTSPTVLTLANHPVEVLWDVKPEFITTLDERLELFENTGIENVVIFEFTKELAHYSAEEYLKNVILKLNPKSITMGYNHHFGAEKTGDDNFLKTAGEKFGFNVSVISPVQLDGKTISSTLIRNLIKTGQASEVVKFLGRAYKIKNKVIKGEQRGRKIGFPTANLTVPTRKIVPGFGVYIGTVIHNNILYNCIINVGLRPTFEDLTEPLVEVHILDFDKDIYGEILEVNFCKKIRNETKFSSIDELKSQIQKDLCLLIEGQN
ncbi:MAG: bifunctional riboflavin kinase/FAD synthetase [Candidatus Gastranaerophilaceae bacterium]|jgi:riboflavin kinase/FMN adenylyltransferase